MSRDKSARPASLTEAIDNLAKVKRTFDNFVTGALAEIDSGNLSRAEALVKEGHSTMLALKDVYNRLYGQIQTAARTKKAEAEKPAESRKENKGRDKEPAKPSASSAPADENDV